MSFAAKKLYYRIGEVCEFLGVEPHVLRYWETEFPRLSPPKNKSGQRTYRPRDIELLLEIRKLLYEDGFTIAGARRRLSSASGGRAAGDGDAGEVRPQAAAMESSPRQAQRLKQVRRELENILTLLESE